MTLSAIVAWAAPIGVAKYREYQDRQNDPWDELGPPGVVEDMVILCPIEIRKKPEPKPE